MKPLQGLCGLKSPVFVKSHSAPYCSKLHSVGDTETRVSVNALSEQIINSEGQTLSRKCAKDLSALYFTVNAMK